METGESSYLDRGRPRYSSVERSVLHPRYLQVRTAIVRNFPTPVAGDNSPPMRKEPAMCESVHPLPASSLQGCGRPLPGSWPGLRIPGFLDRKSTRLNSSHVKISYAVF